MTKSNLALSVGTAFALMFTAAPALAQMGGYDHNDQTHQGDNGGMDHRDMNNGGDMNRDHNGGYRMGHDDHGDNRMNHDDRGGDRMGHDDHGGGWDRGYHHRHCRVMWRHHHRVRRCW